MFDTYASDRKKKKSIVRGTIIATICLVFIVLACFWYVHASLKAVNAKDQTVKQVKIPIGSSAAHIAKILEDNGLIKNKTIFKYYVKWKHESGFQAGNYELSPSMSMSNIIASLKTGKIIGYSGLRLSVPEGYTLDQIANLIAKKTNQNQQAILNKMDNKKFVQDLIEKYPDLLSKDVFKKDIRHPLEGYLYPATYTFKSSQENVAKIVDEMVAVMNNRLQPYKNQMKNKHLSVHQTLTMASLIEEEATAQADRKKIASVFYNRLDKKMPLQTDPTILYSLGKHKQRVMYKDLEVDSPYNTYKNKGLPPSPIASPGRKSIDAALNPDHTGYLYFLADTQTGTVYYAKTLAEHNALKEEHIQ